MNLYWLSKETILTQIQAEKKLSDNVFQPKREILRRRISLVNWQDKAIDKVNINTAAAQINTYIALSYADELKVSFSPRSIGDDEIAANVTNLAEFDFEEMGLDEKNYQKQFDKWFYGLSIRTFAPFDTNRNTPVVDVQDPLSWYSDPYPTGFSAQDFRWHGFEYETTRSELERNGFENIDQIWDKEDAEENANRIAYKSAAWLWSEDDDTPNERIDVYYHYTKFNDRWYFIVTDEAFNTLLKVEEIKAVTIEEKEDPTLIPCPVVLNYFRPKRWNPFGDSIMDFTEDKQRADSKLFNLQLMKATREALGGDFIYNKTKIPNRAELTTPTVNKRYIPVNVQAGESLEGIIKEIPSERLSVDVENMRQMLKRESSTATGIDQVIQGIRGDKSITARESQTIQQNANLNLALNNKVDSWGEKEFWKLWYREYQAHFNESKEKVVKLQKWFGTKISTFKKDDFMASSNIDIVITNKSDVEAKLEKEKLNIPYYVEQTRDPSLPAITKLFLQRKVARLMGMPQNEIDFIYDETIEEKKAKEQVLLLNQNREIKDIDPNEDQKTYLVIYERAKDTEATKKTIRKREEIYKMQRQRQLSQVQPQKWGNSMLNQLTANSMSQQRQGTESASTQDISQ